MDQALPTVAPGAKFKLRSSTKIAVAFVLFAGLVYSAWTYGVGYWILRQHFPAIKPSKVTLLGIPAGTGYKIMVINRVARLVEAKDGKFEGVSGDDQGGGSGGDEGDSSSGKKPIPVKAMLQALSGDVAGLSKFVMTLNELGPNDNWPSQLVVWKAEDIQKALDAPGPLRDKLVKDLNVKLDGTPLDSLSVSALENGIIVDTPGPVHVLVGDEHRLLYARIQRPYKARILADTVGDYKDLARVNNDVRLGYYIQEVGKLKSDSRKKPEDVAAALRDLIKPESTRDYTQRAESVLNSTQVVLTDKYIDSASSQSSPIGGKPLFDINIAVNEEGRRRLWQYSKQHPGDQLMLISDGVAIAAPRIRHELITKNLSIVQLPDKTLVDDAVEFINQNRTQS